MSADYKPKVERPEGTEILRVLAGSRAYGLEDDNSDFDYRGVFVVPTERLLSVGMGRVKETQWIEGGEDDVSWELAHFCNMAIRCNPNVMEVFVAPPAGVQGVTGQALRKLFPAFVSREAVYASFRGYAKNQRVKMFEPTGGVRAGDRMWKFAVSYLRVLEQGRDLLQNGPAYWSVRCEDAEWNEYLRSVKYGKVSKGKIIDLAEKLDGDLTAAYLDSEMQAVPDLARINEFILKVRASYWSERWTI